MVTLTRGSKWPAPQCSGQPPKKVTVRLKTFFKVHPTKQKSLELWRARLGEVWRHCVKESGDNDGEGSSGTKAESIAWELSSV